MNQPFLSIAIHKTARQQAGAAVHIDETPDAWVIRTADRSLRARLKKRHAYPTTYCQQLDQSIVQFGYGDETQDEFLTITIQGNKIVSIVRDNFAVLPLFYYGTESNFFVSNEYADILKNIDTPIVRESVLVDHLMMVDRPMPPPIEGVEVLKEQERLTFQMGEGLVLTQASDRPWLYSLDVPASDPKAFFGKFSAYLDYFIESRLSGQEFAFVVSGGLDSATLPQYFYRKTNQPIVTASLLFGRPYDATQQPKLQTIFEQTAATPIAHALDPKTMAPLSGMTTPRYGEAVYAEAFLPLLHQLRAMGVQVLVTGDGGDEFFGNVNDQSFAMSHGERARVMRQDLKLPDFFTAKLKNAYLSNVPQTPLLPLPHRPANTSFGQLLNNLFIREDIWPVSPFSSPELYGYIQSIPAHFRANKNILRAFHKAKGFTELIYDAPKNEYFDVFFQECFETGAYDGLLESVLPSAHTVALGYVDGAQVQEVYNRVKQGSKMDEDAAFRLYCFFQLEESLRLAGARL